jgi:hypothetical protein
VGDCRQEDWVQGQPVQKASLKNKKQKRVGGMVQVVKCLSSKYKALNLNLSTTQKKKKKKKKKKKRKVQVKN